MRRSSISTRLTAVAVGALLLAGVPAAASTGAGANPSDDSASAAGMAKDPDAAPPDAGPTVSSAGRFSVVTTEAGSTVVWRPRAVPPTGDARLELLLDDGDVRVPLRQLDDRFVAQLSGVTELSPADLSVVAAGRVLDGAATSPGLRPSSPRADEPVAVRRASTLVQRDPGVRGKHETVAFTYRAPKVRVGGFSAKTEVLGRVVVPTKRSAKGKLPLVVILHGRHGTCYSQGGKEHLAWPCPRGSRPTPSYLGYEYVQELLASQGVATVSISANGINAQDDESWDGGAAARSELVRHHLDLLRRANAKGAKGVLGQLEGRLNLRRTVFVGHSRGGEGVNRATVELARSDDARVLGQVLIAPTDFGSQVSPGVPTTVLLPYCDGDVFDLQGQGYVDQGRYVAHGDLARKSAVMMFGANHNYFNTEWTPGMSQAPSSDDWWDASDPACGTKAPQRLTAEQQQAAAATYVAAGVRSVLTKDKDALRLLDGSDVRARSAGKAAVLSAGFTGRRRAVANPAGVLRIKAAKGMAAQRCAGGYGGNIASCDDLARGGLSPHWLSWGEPRTAPWERAVALRWRSAGARVKLSGGKVRDLRGDRVDLRVVAAGPAGTGFFDVVLTDARGRKLRLSPERVADALPSLSEVGRRAWAQTVRVRVPKRTSGFDARKVVSMSLVATSKRGTIFLLDAFTSRTEQPKIARSVTRVPHVEVAALTRAHLTEQPSGVQRVEVGATVTGSSARPSRLAVSVLDLDGMFRERVVRLEPGQRKFSVPIDLPADGVYNPYGGFAFVTVKPLRNAAVSNYVGEVLTTSDAEQPTASFPTRHVEVTQGEAVRWPVELDGLSIDPQYLLGELVAPERGLTELAAGSVPASLFTWSGLPAPKPNVPLSRTGLFLVGEVASLHAGGTIELPTRRTPALPGPRHVALFVYPDFAALSEGVMLTATIRPAP